MPGAGITARGRPRPVCWVRGPRCGPSSMVSGPAVPRVPHLQHGSSSFLSRVRGVVGAKCRAHACQEQSSLRAPFVNSAQVCVAVLPSEPPSLPIPACQQPTHPTGAESSYRRRAHQEGPAGRACHLQNHGVGLRVGQVQAQGGPDGDRKSGLWVPEGERQACPAGFPLLSFAPQRPSSASWVWKVGRKDDFSWFLPCTGLPGEGRAMCYRSESQEGVIRSPGPGPGQEWDKERRDRGTV